MNENSKRIINLLIIITLSNYGGYGEKYIILIINSNACLIVTLVYCSPLRSNRNSLTIRC
jgi:hypothetical protein